MTGCAADGEHDRSTNSRVLCLFLQTNYNARAGTGKSKRENHAIVRVLAIPWIMKACESGTCRKSRASAAADDEMGSLNAARAAELPARNVAHS
jgi:hypothetical protein